MSSLLLVERKYMKHFQHSNQTEELGRDTNDSWKLDRDKETEKWVCLCDKKCLEKLKKKVLKKEVEEKLSPVKKGERWEE